MKSRITTQQQGLKMHLGKIWACPIFKIVWPDRLECILTSDSCTSEYLSRSSNAVLTIHLSEFLYVTIKKYVSQFAHIKTAVSIHVKFNALSSIYSYIYLPNIWFHLIFRHIKFQLEMGCIMLMAMRRKWRKVFNKYIHWIWWIWWQH
jgi:hypothetical protein